ncbi:MAG: two-component system response regulator [Methylococcales bacterium]|nr:MAG: two-component system response regulator [Methylococcales bacterium]
MNFNLKPVILIIDDSPDVINLISGLLKNNYKVKAANNGEKGIKVAQSDDSIDLILLDIMMPGISGFDVCEQLKADSSTSNIPIIFLTSMTNLDDELRGLKLGAVDYVTKPISPPVLLARIENHLKIKAANDFLKDKSSFLESEVTKRSKELAAIQDVTILAMASLAETRDNETGNHILRTKFYVKELAEYLKTHPRFKDALTDHAINILYKSAPLHDIGKVGIPDSILLKPGRLTPEEFEVMKTHTMLGRDAITQAESHLGMEVDFLKFAKEIAYSHQEKWDGSGYPQGLSGDNIPISARLMALADVYDALISRRVYKIGMTHEQAIQIITEGRGTHFDPDITDAFLEINECFREIAQRFPD